MNKKQDVIENIELAIQLLNKTKAELNKIKGENVSTAYNGEYSLEKVKRNCTTVRELVLEVKQSCINRY